MKSLTIAGRIGRDAVLRETNNQQVLNFTVAVNDGYGENKKTMWFDCALWGKRGETLKQYVTKGTIVSVTGELGTREHDGKTYLTIRASDVDLLGGSEAKQADANNDERPARQSHRTDNFARDLDDEIPF